MVEMVAARESSSGGSAGHFPHGSKLIGQLPIPPLLIAQQPLSETGLVRIGGVKRHGAEKVFTFSASQDRSAFDSRRAVIPVHPPGAT
jgi:hypothetical protein